MSGPHGTLAERFWPKVDLSNLRGCWLWLGATNAGYGVIGSGQRGSVPVRAHRVAWEIWNQKKVPAGLELDHFRMNPGSRHASCSRTCVNPRHVEPVSHALNNRRKYGEARCRRGHPRTVQNVYLHPTGGRRACRRCRHIVTRASQVRKKAEKANARSSARQARLLRPRPARNR